MTKRGSLRRLFLSDLSAMSESDKQQALSDFLKPLTPDEHNAVKAMLDCQIRDYEFQEGMSSEEMREKLCRGEIRETDIICQWLFKLNIRERYDHHAGTPSATSP